MNFSVDSLRCKDYGESEWKPGQIMRIAMRTEMGAKHALRRGKP